MQLSGAMGTVVASNPVFILLGLVYRQFGPSLIDVGLLVFKLTSNVYVREKKLEHGGIPAHGLGGPMPSYQCGQREVHYA